MRACVYICVYKHIFANNTITLYNSIYKFWGIYKISQMIQSPNILLYQQINKIHVNFKYVNIHKHINTCSTSQSVAIKNSLWCYWESKVSVSGISGTFIISFFLDIKGSFATTSSSVGSADWCKIGRLNETCSSSSWDCTVTASFK